MTKKIFIISLSMLIALSMFQTTVFASEIGIKLVGQREDMINTPIERNGVSVFPIGQIFKFLDISGTETVMTHVNPPYSNVTFQGMCYRITQGESKVQEFEVDEAGDCINATGKEYLLETPASYTDEYDNGIFVPLGFISNILAASPYGNKFDTRYLEKDEVLEFRMYNIDASGKKQISNPITLAMKINSPWLLTEDDGNLFDEVDHSVTPIIQKGSTLLPIAPIVEQIGGKVLWTGSERKVAITLNQDIIELWIDKKTAVVNGNTQSLDITPTIIKGKTMIPVRFVTENLGAVIRWHGDSQVILIYYGGAEESDTDVFNYGYKISMLDAYQKQQDNPQPTLSDIVDENIKKHNEVQYNDTDPLDYYGKLIRKGDTVGLGTFSGYVKEIRGTKVRVYWDTASFLVDAGKERETAKIYGITWLADQWMDAKAVILED